MFRTIDSSALSLLKLWKTPFKRLCPPFLSVQNREGDPRSQATQFNRSISCHGTGKECGGDLVFTLTIDLSHGYISQNSSE